MIDLIWTLKIAVRALKANKMRSALTMLGVIIGVGAVIAMLAIGTGASQRISKQIQSIGSNLLIILPGSTTSGGVRMGAGTQPTLTLRDADAIKKECLAVAAVAPILNGVAQIVYGHTNWSTAVQGSTPDILAVRDWPVQSGRPFTLPRGDEGSTGRDLDPGGCRRARHGCLPQRLADPQETKRRRHDT